MLGLVHLVVRKGCFLPRLHAQACNAGYYLYRAEGVKQWRTSAAAF